MKLAKSAWHPPGLFVDWIGEPSAEAREHITITKQAVHEAAKNVGIPDTFTNELAFMLTEEPIPTASPNHVTGDYISDEGIAIEDENGKRRPFADLIYVSVRDGRGNLRSAEDLTSTAYHELIHMKQQRVDGVHKSWFNSPTYNAEPSKKVGTAATIGSAVTAFGAGNEAFYTGYNNGDPITRLAERLFDLPYSTAIVTAGLGILAVGAAGITPFVGRIARSKFESFKHTTNKYEREASTGAKRLAKQGSIFTVA